MGILSSLFFGEGKKKKEERLQRAAQGQSVVGNVLGSSPYMKEWGRQKRDILEQYDNKERSLRKQWRREDEQIARDMSKAQGRYERKMGPEKAGKYYGAYERLQKRIVQRGRDRELLEMEQEKNEAIRNIQKNIKQWKDS